MTIFRWHDIHDSHYLFGCFLHYLVWDFYLGFLLLFLLNFSRMTLLSGLHLSQNMILNDICKIQKNALLNFKFDLILTNVVFLLVKAPDRLILLKNPTEFFDLFGHFVFFVINLICFVCSRKHQAVCMLCDRLAIFLAISHSTSCSERACSDAIDRHGDEAWSPLAGHWVEKIWKWAILLILPVMIKCRCSHLLSEQSF